MKADTVYHERKHEFYNGCWVKNKVQIQRGGGKITEGKKKYIYYYFKYNFQNTSAKRALQTNKNLHACDLV